MATPTYATSSELDAVNSILMSVGESPVNTLETQSPEVAIAQTTLRQITREIQAEGWSFNSEQAVKMIPDVNDQIELGDNILSVDINRYYHTDTYDVTMKATSSTVNAVNVPREVTLPCASVANVPAIVPPETLIPAENTGI